MKYTLRDENGAPYNSPEAINEFIQESKVDTNLISDGYHTFGELYKHRLHLYIALCKSISENKESPESKKVWKSRKHSDGELCFGEGTWFVMGIGEMFGNKITYHLPNEYWNNCYFAEELAKAPIFDGHTPDDVLERLLKI